MRVEATLTIYVSRLGLKSKCYRDDHCCSTSVYFIPLVIILTMERNKNENSSSRSKRSRSCSVDSSLAEEEITNEEKRLKTDYFPASKLFEYQWPLGNDGADFYMLQEQVKEFLDIRGIQRKYPDLYRRNMDIDERKYLLGRGVVTEMQSNMGLVALRSEEVLELMAEEYPRKYEEYQAILQEREFQATLRRKGMESKRVAMQAESMVIASDITDAALRGVVSYNSQLAEIRRSVRKEYMDNQTNLVHVPRRPPVVLPSPRLSRYPVALLPGQYSDQVRQYSATELNKLPLNTVVDASTIIKKVPEQQITSDSTSSTDLISNSILRSLFSRSVSGSSSSPSTSLLKPNISLSSSILSAILSKSLQSASAAKNSLKPHVGGVNANESVSLESKNASLGIGTNNGSKVDVTVVGSSGVKIVPSSPAVAKEMPSASIDTKVKQTIKSSLCRVCFKGRSCNKLGHPEDMITCSICNGSIHPSCYDLNKKGLTILRSYPWQCLDCKTCQLCSNPDNEDKMMCCDECDRGYHSFCVGLTEIPSGQWSCKICSSCASCGCITPSGPGGRADSAEVRWKHEYHKGKFIHTLCHECSAYFRKGFFCPICLKVYHDDETDSPMVCCDSCDRWIHTECDGISDERYKELSKEDKSTYVCCICRGEVRDAVDKYHKKNRTSTCT